jgi:hypothetical protein
MSDPNQPLVLRTPWRAACAYIQGKPGGIYDQPIADCRGEDAYAIAARAAVCHNACLQIPGDPAAAIKQAREALAYVLARLDRDDMETATALGLDAWVMEAREALRALGGAP